MSALAGRFFQMGAWGPAPSTYFGQILDDTQLGRLRIWLVCVRKVVSGRPESCALEL